MTTKPNPSDPNLFAAALPGESVTKIWDFSMIPDRNSGRIEFPALIHFKGWWYCSFREAEIHNNHPSGRARLIRSADGEKWETVKIFDWDCGDVREPKFSITPEGNLLINTSVYFVSREPRDFTKDQRKAPGTYTPPEGRKKKDVPGAYYQLDYLGTVLNLPDSNDETLATQQTVTWLSSDGVNWSGAFACETGLNTWRWDVTWHNGMGYGVAQWGKDITGTVYRTRDGKSWRALKTDFFPENHAGEAALAFDDADDAICLLRGGNGTNILLGRGKAPYYQEWSWTIPTVDYGPEDGGSRPASELGTGLGGPVIKRLSDGRFVGAGRALGPNRTDGHATLFWVDPVKNHLTMFAEMDGTTYPGVVERDGMLWVSYVSSRCHEDVWEVMLAKVKIP